MIRLPRVFSCYQPPSAAPAVAPLPAAKAGYITFGSFNNANKLNDTVLRLWARVLRQTPDAKLILKDAAFQNAAMRGRVQKAFEAEAVATDRLVLLGRDNDMATHLGRYSEIDIALDPHPYCGTTTTCEALWMGVPVVTLAGADHRARVGASQLRALGMDDLVATDAEDYVAIARRLAGDVDALAERRANLRMRFAASPLMDYRGFTRELEQAYLGIWSKWCEHAASPAPAGGARGR